jgi:hypothetical protein
MDDINDKIITALEEKIVILNKIIDEQQKLIKHLEK